MRTIKFRGLRPDGKGWVHGNLHTNTITGDVFIIVQDQTINCAFISSTSHQPTAPAIFQVDPETVGQFTGYKSPSKQDLYAGDTIAEDGLIIGTVKYSDENGAFIVIDQKDYLVEFLSDFGSGAGDWEIAGNIHQTNA